MSNTKRTGQTALSERLSRDEEVFSYGNLSSQYKDYLKRKK